MFDKFGRPDWDSYFIALAFVTATRSIDPNTKHGCIITDKSHRILSIGYNGPPRGLDDSKIPLTRPEKYPFMAHAEENAILNRNDSMEGSIAYVTGHPCHKCFRMLLQEGVSRIVYGPVGFQGDDTDRKLSLSMLAMKKKKNRVTLVAYKGDFTKILQNVMSQYAPKDKAKSKKRRKKLKR